MSITKLLPVRVPPPKGAVCGHAPPKGAAFGRAPLKGAASGRAPPKGAASSRALGEAPAASAADPAATRLTVYRFCPIGPLIGAVCVTAQCQCFP